MAVKVGPASIDAGPLNFMLVMAGAVLLVHGVKMAGEEIGKLHSSGGSGAQQGANASGTPAPLSEQQAASKWGVPVGILHGVGGMETDYGKLIDTSSAGAKGKYQFLQSTASGYGYPWVNSNDSTVIGQQTDAAAHFLHDLFAQTHDWNAALQHYSGGGYGLSAVQAKAEGLPTS